MKRWRKKIGENMNKSFTKRARNWIVIVDLDGTIIDSEAINFSFLEKLLEEFGYTNQRDTILKGLAEGKKIEEIMQMINMTCEVKRKMEKRMTVLMNQVSIPLLPGVAENLRVLQDIGLLFGIVTDDNIHTVSRVIHEHGLEKLFDSKFILTRDTFPALKPSPKIVSEFFKRSGREKAIIVGNTPKEVALARNSKCPAVIITDGKGLESKTAEMKDTFKYEWEAYGGISGEDIYCVQDWESIKGAIIEIIKNEERCIP